MTVDAIEAAFTGRVGKEPELRISQGGKSWASFTVAVGADEATQWVRVAVFGEAAEDAGRTLVKGSRVYVEGRLRLDTWEKDGEKRAGLNVAAWLVQPMGQIGKRKPKRQAEATCGKARLEATPDDAVPF